MQAHGMASNLEVNTLNINKSQLLLFLENFGWGVSGRILQITSISKLFSEFHGQRLWISRQICRRAKGRKNT